MKNEPREAETVVAYWIEVKLEAQGRWHQGNWSAKDGDTGAAFSVAWLS
jgi:hypothetical protein